MSDTRNYESAFSLFSKSKVAVLKNKENFFVIMILPWLISYIGEVLQFGLGGQPWTWNGDPAASLNPLSSMLGLVSFVLTIIFIPAYVKLALEASKGNVTNPKELITSSLKYFWRLVGLYLLLAILMALGLIFFIVPGLIVIKRYLLSAYYLVDQDLGIRESMSRSAEAAKGNGMAIWGVIGVTILLAFTAVLPLVGAIVSTALTTLYACAPALRYFELGGDKASSLTSAAPVAPVV